MSKLDELGGLSHARKIANYIDQLDADASIVMDALIERIDELERENKDEARLHHIAHSRCLARYEALTDKLQSARELAEMIDGAGEYLIQQYKLEGLVDKAREFLEGLE